MAFNRNPSLQDPASLFALSSSVPSHRLASFSHLQADSDRAPHPERSLRVLDLAEIPERIPLQLQEVRWQADEEQLLLNEQRTGSQYDLQAEEQLPQDEERKPSQCDRQAEERSLQNDERTDSQYDRFTVPLSAPGRSLQAISSNRAHPREQDDRLLLCIGGQFLETSRQTLCMDSKSMLAAWVLRHLPHGNNVLWIDRDAKRFKHVLNYLRNGTIWLEDVASLRAVQEEAAFFGLTGLETLCEQRIQNIQAREEAMLKEKTEGLQEALRGMLENLYKCSLPCSRSKGEVVAILRGRRLGSGDADEPVFRMDAEF